MICSHQSYYSEEAHQRTTLIFMYVLPSLWSVKRTRQRRSAAVVKKKESEHAIF